MPVVRRNPEDLLAELGITEPEEIDVDTIAAYCDAFVLYEFLSGSEARIVGNGNRAFITVNTQTPRSRQRFSIGHELGHWMWDRGKMALSCSKDVQDGRWYGTDKEALANKFASDLLLPASMFTPRAHLRDATLETVKELADTFQASLTATAIRLVSLGSFPCMAIMHSKARLLWHRGSEAVDGKLWPHKQLDQYSFAYDLMRGDTKGIGSGMVDADIWINHPQAERFELFESSAMIGPDRVFSLLWWKSERMILDLMRGR